MLFTRVGNWRRDARRLRVSFALSLSLLFSLSLSQSRLSLPPFFSFLLSISLTRHPTLSYHPSLSLCSTRVFPPPLLFCSREKHIVRRNVHIVSPTPSVRVWFRVALSLSLPSSDQSVFQQRALRPLLQNAASRFAIVLADCVRERGRWSKGMIRRKGSPLASEMSVNASRSLCTLLFFLLFSTLLFFTQSWPWILFPPDFQGSPTRLLASRVGHTDRGSHLPRIQASRRKSN